MTQGTVSKNRKLKNKPANIQGDEEFLKEFPYINRKIKVHETDKIKRREAIILRIVKQIPSDNYGWYVKYNRDSDTYYIGKEDEKNFFVIDSSDDEGSKKRKMRKRKNEESVDETNQLQKKRKKIASSCSTDRSKKQKKNKSKDRN